MDAREQRSPLTAPVCCIVEAAATAAGLVYQVVGDDSGVTVGDTDAVWVGGGVGEAVCTGDDDDVDSLTLEADGRTVARLGVTDRRVGGAGGFRRW
jgi:hypothetical protein